MAGRYPYETRRKYPHMSGDDKSVWNQFVEENPDYFETVDYDWRVGKGVDTSGIEGENYKRMVTMLSQHRIDAIGWTGEKPTIVEVKGRATFTGLGQLIGYKSLFVEEFPNIPAPDILMIAWTIDPDDLKVFDWMSIKVIII